MKTILPLCLSFLMLASLPAAVKINIAASQLNTSNGVAAPQSSLVLLVADTAGNGFSPVQASANVSLAAFLNGSDDLIIGRWSLGGSSTTNGQFSDTTGTLNLTTTLATGKPLALIWFPSLTLSSNAATGGTSYGVYSGPAVDGSAPWTVPSDGSLVDAYFFTQNSGGTNANTLGNASQSVALSNVAINLSASPIEGGNVSGGGTSVSLGSSITVSAIANTRFYFSRWMENEIMVSGNANYQFTVTQARTLLAVFNKRPGVDFNADGQSDLLWHNQNNGTVSTWFMNGTTHLSGNPFAVVNPNEWSLIGTGDFNADVHKDLLWRNKINGTVSVWFMNGITRISGTPIATVDPVEWDLVGASDFNADGQSDLLWRNKNNGTVSVWFMNGVTRVSGTPIATVDPVEWNLVGASDFNADGQSDLLWRNKNNGTVSVWFMNGVTRISGTPIATVDPVEWNLVGASDFDADGQSDLLWRNKNNGTVSVWFMNGVTRISGTPIATVDPVEWSLINP